jgi:hypothetical protein
MIFELKASSFWLKKQEFLNHSSCPSRSPWNMGSLVIICPLWPCHTLWIFQWKLLWVMVFCAIVSSNLLLEILQNKVLLTCFLGSEFDFWIEEYCIWIPLLLTLTKYPSHLWAFYAEVGGKEGRHVVSPETWLLKSVSWHPQIHRRSWAHHQLRLWHVLFCLK